MGPVKTLLVSENFPPLKGGSGNWFWELYRRLPRDQFLIAAGQHPRQQEFDATHDLNLQRLPLTFRSRGIIGCEGLRGYLRAVRELAPLIKREEIGMIHCGRTLPEGLMAWLLQWRFRIPYACYVHGEELNTASTSRELTWLTRRVLRRAGYIIANSRNTAGLLRERWQVPAERIEVMHPGVDVACFQPAPPAEDLRQRFGWAGRRVVLTVGRLQKRKGHDILIRALPLVRATIPDVLYAIAGAGEEESHLRELVAKERLDEHVQFLGEPSDEELVRRYQQCDLFVLPNRAVEDDIEGFGIVLLEAQACGKAAVAGASGGTAETMRIPESGRVVNCDAPEPLAKLLIELLEDADLRRRMGEAGRRWVVDTFDYDKLARQAEQIFARRGQAG